MKTLQLLFAQVAMIAFCYVGIFFFIFPLLAQANPLILLSGSPPVAGGWSQILDEDGVDTFSLGNTAANTYRGSRFQADNTGTVTAVKQFMSKVGAPSTYHVEIWSDDGGGTPLPSALLTNGQQSFDADAVIDSGATDYTINYSTGPSITSGTFYWCIIHAGAADGSNFVILTHDASPSGTGEGGSMAKADATPTWSQTDPTDDLRATVNGT